jgi:peptidoglycan LD-endopeptidase LytH
MPALFLAFVVGGLTGWSIHATKSTRRSPETPVVTSPSIAPSPPSSSAHASREPEPTQPATIPVSGDEEFDPITELRRRALRLPLDGANAAMMQGGFAALRRGEPRGHEAVDLLAPRNALVRAVEDGKIAKLFFSRAGGNTVYQFDPSERFCYYYAHLDHYADGLRDGQLVAKGEVIGYVGTTGNARPDTPHLHFAILELGDDKRWWHGTAIDPYLVFGP